ncbi:MAG: hypothetical protein Q9214_000875 [Letrouitia sp. 1 TL-2023]
MVHGPSEEDKSLLERLKALGPTSVTFDPTNSFSALPKPSRDANDLAIRFQNLNGSRVLSGDLPPLSTASQDHDDGDALPSSPTVEELLTELGPEEQWDINVDETTQIDQLLKEAEEALATSKTNREKDRSDTTLSTEAERESEVTSNADQTHRSRSHSASSSRNDDAEAEAQLQRILDELSVEDVDQENRNVDSASSGGKALDLPTAPSNTLLPLSRQGSDRIDKEDNSRFPAVPLGLPSVPINAPSQKGGLQRKVSSKYTDEEIDSWCIICCSDAQVRCRGCDDDMFCLGCWREGHVGGDVGWEEKGHSWTGLGSLRGSSGGGRR